MEICIEGQKYRTGDIYTKVVKFKIPERDPRFGRELNASIHRLLQDIITELVSNKWYLVDAKTDYYTALEDYGSMRGVRCHVIEVNLFVTKRLTKVRK